jgi:nucleoside-diphosphate-sugar epimerase
VTDTSLTVAITGPTGTFGNGLLPLLERDNRIREVIGIARRPFDPAAHGWTKMHYRQGDVRDYEGLKQSFVGSDVVVHLAFIVLGSDQRAAEEINIQGTINAFRAAAASGAKRFVYSSSVAAYGFHKDNPDILTEDWPTRPAIRMSYAQEKARLEQLLASEAKSHPDIDLYLLRSPIVLGPHAVGVRRELCTGRCPTRSAGHRSSVADRVT